MGITACWGQKDKRLSLERVHDFHLEHWYIDNGFLDSYTYGKTFDHYAYRDLQIESIM